MRLTLQDGPIDVHVTEAHPWYQVWVNGEIYDQFTVAGPPLTWSQQYDVAASYRDGLIATHEDED